MNYTRIAILLLILALIIIPVHALIPRVEQGDQVAIGQTYDISGVTGWAESLAWYGYSGDMEINPSYVLELPDLKSGYYKFYIDPTIFSQRLGPWFQFYGNNTNIEHGNLLAFRVVKQLDANLTKNVTNVTTPVPTPTPVAQIVLPKRFDTDFQIAYGDPFSVTVNEKYMPARLWVFGRVDAFYNRSYPTSRITVTPKDIQSLEAGAYTVLVQNPGKNAIFEAGYSKIITDIKTTEELVSPWAAVKPIDIFGLQPRMVMVQFRNLLKPTDDVLTEYRLEIANPVIDIITVDNVYYEGKDAWDVRGYTNVAKNTELTFIFDPDRQTPKTISANTYHGIVQEDAPNYWRYFQVFIPVDYENTPKGEHWLKVTTPQGANQTIQRWFYDIPKGQETPNETTRYSGGNEWFPKPTAEIVTVVQTVIQTETVYVPVTPNQEQVDLAQKRASDANWRYWITNGLIVAAVGVIIGGGGWYIYSVVKRARLR